MDTDTTSHESDLLAVFLDRRQWEREQNIPLDDIVPPLARLAVAFSDDAIESLMDHWEESGVWLWMRPDDIGWDIFRHGRTSGCGEDQFHRLLIGRDDHYTANTRMGCVVDLPNGTEDWTDHDAAAAERAAYIDARYSTFNRTRSPADKLLIDLADEALHKGWDAPPEIIAAVEQLRAIAENAPTRREAAETRAIILKDETAIEAWRLAQVPPVPSKGAREAHYQFRVAAQRAANDAKWQITLDHSAASARATTDAMQDAADADEEAGMIAWQAQYGNLFPEQSEPEPDQDNPMTAGATLSNVIPLPLPPAAPISAALKLTYFDECNDRAPKRWLIKNVIAKGESSSWFGAPGSMKSALLTDMGVHVASGRNWREFKNKESAGVVYFAFERADLVRRRLAAYTIRDGLKDVPIAVADTLIDLVNPNCVDIMVATIRQAEERFKRTVGLIILDTWSKGIAAGGGDEDKAQYQNFVAANLKRVHEHCALHIAGIGHSGKDESRGERGSNARQGDVDLQVQITGSAIKTATVIKANDQPDGALTSFGMDTIALGTDEDGDPVTTGILSARAFAGPQSTKPISPRLVLALDALSRAIEAHGTVAPAVAGMGNKAVAVDHWREELFRAGVLDKAAANPRADFKRIKDPLTVANRIEEQDGLVWLVNSGQILPPLPPGK
ncbi:AAA family ATPase [Tardiphaga sp. vice352]|uniref:AAA family ATPase n=1 Tax=Tardiphaga sp. vice352 TaxID=2592816 RepID=UPI001161F6C4|nr:AAA family ATPase [Tardiphaga sp. vice352]QDM32175.1 AAA family ATPase [Tardiphaga sp. vice352]